MYLKVWWAEISFCCCVLFPFRTRVLITCHETNVLYGKAPYKLGIKPSDNMYSYRNILCSWTKNLIIKESVEENILESLHPWCLIFTLQPMKPLGWLFDYGWWRTMMIFTSPILALLCRKMFVFKGKHLVFYRSILLWCWFSLMECLWCHLHILFYWIR